MDKIELIHNYADLIRKKLDLHFPIDMFEIFKKCNIKHKETTLDEPTKWIDSTKIYLLI